MLEISDKKILILDYDGVIVNSMETFYKWVKYVSDKMKLNLSDEQCRTWKTRHDFEKLFQEIWADIALWYKYFHEFCDEEKHPWKYELFQWVKNIILECSEKFHIILFTDRKFDSTYAWLNNHKLTHLFNEVVTSECTWVRKPSPDGIHLWLQRLQKTSKDVVLYVWDSSVDFLAAQEAGVSFLWVDSWVNSKDDWQAIDVESIPSLLHLPEYLKNTWN